MTVRSVALSAIGAALATILIISAGACTALSPPTPREPPRLVYFGPGNVSPGDDYAFFRNALKQAGWTDGENLEIDWRVSTEPSGFAEWMPELENDVAHGRPVVITTDSTPHALALKQATSTVSIVVGIRDPVATGVVGNQLRPGGNITGLATSREPQSGKRLEVLKGLLPNLKRLGVLYADTATPNLATQLQAFAGAALDLSIDIAPAQAQDPAGFSQAIARLAQDRADAVYLVQDGITSSYVSELSELATRSGLPSMCTRPDWVQRGCLVSYSAQRSATQALRVNYIDKIFRGARPGDLPIQVPTTFDLSVNLQTLQALRLTIPGAAQQLVTEWVE